MMIRAIALSQQDLQGGPSTSRPVEADGDDAGDEDLRKALLLSQEEARAPKRVKREETPEEERLELERFVAIATGRMKLTIAQGHESVTCRSRGT
jgi:tyrosyl-DNA phosphodiesterase-1